MFDGQVSVSWKIWEKGDVEIGGDGGDSCYLRQTVSGRSESEGKKSFQFSALLLLGLSTSG
jgi:hypothetical protein